MPRSESRNSGWPAPEGTWYTYVDEQDIDEIVDSHLVAGKVVERLLIDR
jgi:(2Fe-2S) ferredoxin